MALIETGVLWVGHGRWLTWHAIALAKPVEQVFIAASARTKRAEFFGHGPFAKGAFVAVGHDLDLSGRGFWCNMIISGAAGCDRNIRANAGHALQLLQPDNIVL